MARAKPYLDIPGTTVFDAEQSHRGYALNQFCMSLMRPENRARFLADERAYLAAWPLSEAQREAILARDFNKAIALGGNIYFLAKLGATDGLTFQRMASAMTGMSEGAYREMMLRGGRPIEGNRQRPRSETELSPARPLSASGARVTGAVFTSHVPAVGVALDQGKTEEPYWRPIFQGYEPSRHWLADHLPDVVILVYNDHATSFSLDLIPTFAMGTGAVFAPADEGWGARAVPPVMGDPDLAAHLAQFLIESDFDLAVAQKLDVDHGLTVPLSLLCGQPAVWPFRVIPLAVNVVQYPAPSGARCFALGRALRRAVEAYEKPLRVQVWGTGGMSHQLQGPRAGLINTDWDRRFLDRLIEDPAALARVPAIDYLREAGSEGIELVMWLVARGALGDVAGGPAPTVVRRFYHVPASNTAVGHLVLEDTSPQDIPQDSVQKGSS